MNELKRACEIIDEKKEEMLETLQKLVSIPSVEKEAKENAPFGEDVDRAFKFMLEQGEKSGFETFNADNYGGHIEYRGKDEGTLGIVGHLDVVPEGKDWKYEPFGGTIEDGKLYGRGAIDDKGPVISAFYAMKALKEAGFEPAKSVRLILGLDEETNWRGMEYYLSKTNPPDIGFSPDGEFPVISGEKGIIVFDIAGKFGKSQSQGLSLRTVKGGNAPNMVSDYARAIVLSDDKQEYEKVRSAIESVKNEKGYRILGKQIGKSFEITSLGVSAHGARPETGTNAISIIMEVLGKLNFTNDDVNSFIEFYNRHIGYELDGESIGCNLQDDISGNLIFNVGMIDVNQKQGVITINVRYPITLTSEIVYDSIMPVINEYDLGIIKGKEQRPIYTPEDSPLITTLMRVYQKHTKDTETKPLIIGGGTYARAIPNTVAFGPSMANDKEIAHQKNEFIQIEHLMMITKIYAEAIYELSKEGMEND